MSHFVLNFFMDLNTKFTYPLHTLPQEVSTKTTWNIFVLILFRFFL